MSSPIRHELKVVLSPEGRHLSVEDRITVPKDAPEILNFLLHAGLNPSTSTQGVIVQREQIRTETIPLELLRIELPSGQRTFTLLYGGTIHHPVQPVGKEQARGFSDTPGIISQEGIYLSGNSFWYPVFDRGFVAFQLSVELPTGWDAVSQGDRTIHQKGDNATRVQWNSPEPQDEIYLVAAAFTEYAQQAGKVTDMVFLRSPDQELARKYLDAAGQYAALYEELIGPYPYTKFALVENFWESGFGMPSFTLLGPKVIRLPFIINSSYPHEILHNWWGNSVFPDYGSGNWSEGLTAYLSDHLIKEQQGNGVEYRQTTLQKYVDYVLEGRDFPLTEFRSRHSSPTEAVGYGKSLMFFHMLRLRLGDEKFIAGLQRFYREHMFSTASFGDLKKSFSEAAGEDLNAEFEQWIARKGAPELRLKSVKADIQGSEFVLKVIVEQVQSGKLYRLRIPVAVTMEGRAEADQTVVTMEKKLEEFSIRLPSRPLRIDIDPEFDLFRRLDRQEIPPALSQALGSEQMLILLPSSANKTLFEAYYQLAQSLSKSGPGEADVRLDSEVKRLPSDRAVIIIGWENMFVNVVQGVVSDYAVSIDKRDLRIENTEYPKKNHSVVLTAGLPGNRDLALAFIATDSPDALSGLGRKLPHYHKYSYLVFEGDEPANVGKGRWQVMQSPLSAFLAGGDGQVSLVKTGVLAERQPLARIPRAFSKERMTGTVRFLASAELKGRGLGTPELDQAAEFIAGKFREAGLEPGGDEGKSYFQTWTDPELNMSMKNVIGVIPGKKRSLSGQSVVVGAHYDHLGLGWPDVRAGNEGKIHPGADDNASGVAVLVELARVLKENLSPDRSIVFVAFTGEEAGKRGSKYYAANEKAYPASQIIGMLNLDTVGRLGKKKLLALGAGSAQEWFHVLRGAGFVTGVEIDAVSEELDASDYASFQEIGVPSIELFAGAHSDYHRPTDTPDKIDSEGLVKVASVAKEIIEYLANREEPLTVTAETGHPKSGQQKSSRKVSLGTIPDFSFHGTGVRLSGVMAGSPAEASGLKEGDIITRISDSPVNSLKEFSAILKSLKPGDKISVTILRDGQEQTVETEVVER